MRLLGQQIADVRRRRDHGRKNPRTGVRGFWGWNHKGLIVTLRY